MTIQVAVAVVGMVEVVEHATQVETTVVVEVAGLPM
jgi:hypothetical protein